MFNGEELSESNNVRFPITSVGQTSSVKVLVENNSEEDIELIPYVIDEQVKIKDYKQFLKPRESMLTTLEFSPDIKREISLNTPIGFRTLIG